MLIQPLMTSELQEQQIIAASYELRHHQSPITLILRSRFISSLSLVLRSTGSHIHCIKPGISQDNEFIIPAASRRGVDIVLSGSGRQAVCVCMCGCTHV